MLYARGWREREGVGGFWRLDPPSPLFLISSTPSPLYIHSLRIKATEKTLRSFIYCLGWGHDPAYGEKGDDVSHMMQCFRLFHHLRQLYLLPTSPGIRSARFFIREGRIEGCNHVFAMSTARE